MTDLRNVYIDALIARVRYIYEGAPSLQEPLITTPYWDELQDLERRIEGLLWGQWEPALVSVEMHAEHFEALPESDGAHFEGPKRRTGAGSIYQRQDSRWVASIMRAGRRISRYTRTEAEAQEALAALVEQGEPLTGTASEPDSASPPAPPPHEDVQEVGDSASSASGEHGASVLHLPHASPDAGPAGCTCPEWWKRARVFTGGGGKDVDGEHHYDACQRCKPALNEAQSIEPEVQSLALVANDQEREPIRRPTPQRSHLIGRQPVASPSKPKCVAGCGAEVSGEGKRCRTCAGAARRDRPLKQYVPPRAIAPRVETISAPEPDFPIACTCAEKRAVLTRGDWHEPTCPMHAHRFALPPGAGLDGQEYPMTCACGTERTYTPPEPYNGRNGPQRNGQAVEAST